MCDFEWRALGDKIIVSPNDPPETSAGGVVLVSTERHSTLFGTVVSVGEGKLLDSGYMVSVGLKIGDTVAYASRAGRDLVVPGGNYIALLTDEVIAVKTEPDAF